MALDKSTEKLTKIVARRGISPHSQKMLWASMRIFKHHLIKAGTMTEGAFDAEVDRLVAEIDLTIENKVRKELGLKRRER